MKKTYPTTIEALRKSGWKVLVIHNPILTTSNSPLVKFQRPVIKQVETTVALTKDGKHTLGFATSHPKETHNRKLGNKIALGRALKNFEKGNFVDDDIFNDVYINPQP